MKQQGIELYHTSNPDIKCSITERFIRTLRLWLQKVFTHREKYRYIDCLLEDVTWSYNHRYHTTIKMSPHEASQPDRVLEVYRNLYSKTFENTKKSVPKYHEGDYVRISREKKKDSKRDTHGIGVKKFSRSQKLSGTLKLSIKFQKLTLVTNSKDHFILGNSVKSPSLNRSKLHI